MKKPRVCLKDIRVLQEINNHKWLESEKMGRDIGFDVAAVDWVNRFGDQFQRPNAHNCACNSSFIERREFRRFKWDNYVKLISELGFCCARVININCFGLLCRTAHHYEAGSRMRIHISYGRTQEESLNCLCRVERSTFHASAKTHELYLKFEDSIYKKLIDSEFFKKADLL